MEPMEDILNSSLIPTLFGSDTPFPDDFTSLFSLPPKEGGLGISLLKEEAREQYYGSSIITEAHVKSIIHQEMIFQLLWLILCSKIQLFIFIFIYLYSYLSVYIHIHAFLYSYSCFFIFIFMLFYIHIHAFLYSCSSIYIHIHLFIFIFML